MKITFFVMLWAFIFVLVGAGVCPPVAADIWTSGKVVYSTNAYGDSDIAVMGPNGKHIAQLTASSDPELSPTMSPDGNKVLYVRQESWTRATWIMDADGSNQRQIALAVDPSWAPSGDRFVAVYNSDAFEIYVLNEVRDNWVEALTVGVDDGNLADPAWSPDGNYIAYVAGTSDLPGHGGSLYVYDVAADRSTKIVSGSPGRYMSDPTWGPLSYRIVFGWQNAGFADGAEGIFSVTRDGGKLGIINWWGGYSLSHPTVAPYGGELIYTRYDPDTGNRSLYKVTRRTNNWRRIGLSGATDNDDADWWHPSYFSVEPGASQLTTTWGGLKKKTK